MLPHNTLFTLPATGPDPNGDALAVDKIVNMGAESVFVCLDDVDHVGHASGFGTAYDAAMVKADRKLGQLSSCKPCKRARKIPAKTGWCWPRPTTAGAQIAALHIRPKLNRRKLSWQFPLPILCLPRKGKQ